MRKSIFPVSLIILAALVLSACSRAAATPAAPTTAVTTGTPAAATSPTAVVTAQATTAATTAATTGATTAATAPAVTAPAATTVATTAATTSATTQATQSAANQSQTGTPQASAPGAANTPGTVNVGQYVSLTNLLNSNVNASDNAVVGRVDGVLVQHPLIPETAESSSDQATATPAPTLTAAERVMTVRYLLVNVANGAAATPQGTGGTTAQGKGNEVIVPWQALALSGGTQTAGTVNLNVASAAVAGAPRETLVNIAGGSTAWSASTLQYWTSQGLTIPATGDTSSAQTANNLFLIPRERGGINIADEKDQVLGTTSDILVDPANGQIAYLVFNAGPTFNNKTFAIPVNNLTWGPGTSPVSVNNRGQFTLNFPSNILSNAPSLNNLQLDPNTINTLNQFWQSIQNNAGGTTP